jgi:hypothetical protein
LAVKPSSDSAFIRLVKGLPVQGVERVDERIERLRFLFDSVKERFGFVYLGNVHVGDMFELSHRDGLRHCLFHRLVKKELASPFCRSINRFGNPVPK